MECAHRDAHRPEVLFTLRRVEPVLNIVDLVECKVCGQQSRPFHSEESIRDAWSEGRRPAWPPDAPVPAVRVALEERHHGGGAELDAEVAERWRRADDV